MTDTVDRILEGALTALARRGPRKLSMSDVCEEAGISRGTLYRYFKNKTEVLDAVAGHVERGSREQLAAAIAERSRPEDRLDVVLGVVTQYGWLHPGALRILDHEPQFALTFVRSVFPRVIELVTEALEPAAGHIPAVRDGALTVSQLGELALRLGLSTFFVPGPDTEQLPAWLERLASRRRK